MFWINFKILLTSFWIKNFLSKKLLANKFDYIRLANAEPSNQIHKTLVNHSPLCANKKNSSMNAHRYSFVYFIDDLNMDYSCRQRSSSTIEVARQLLESQSLYLNENDHFLPMKHVNYVYTCGYPNKTPNHLPLKQSFTKHLVCVHLNSFNEKYLIESIFMSPVQHWLEEFPSNLIQYPYEMSIAIIKSLTDVYQTVQTNFRPVPSKPFYLFSFKDLARVVQGVQLLASKSKVLPVKAIKKRIYFPFFSICLIFCWSKNHSNQRATIRP